MESESSFGNFAGRSSSKWRRFDADVLPMHVAEMDFEVAKPIRDRLVAMVENSDLGYLGPLPEIAPAFASYALDAWGWEIEQPALKMATDVGVAAVEILRTVAQPGEQVLINSPVYSAFFKWIEEANCTASDAPMRLTDGRWELDLSAIEQKYQQGIKIHLLCSPHNPLGTVHTAQELTELSKLADKYDVLVISDEIHAPLSWVPFTPYLALGEAAERTGVTITSSSKAWNTAGLKAGFLITQSDQVRQKLKTLPEAMQWRSAILGAFGMVTAFTEGRPWLEQTISRMQENLEHLHLELSKQLPKAKVFEMESTYLAWIDLGEYRLGDPQAVILKEARVALVPGQDHGGDQYRQYVRFNFATSKERITEAVRRMASVLEG